MVGWTTAREEGEVTLSTRLAHLWKGGVGGGGRQGGGGREGGTGGEGEQGEGKRGRKGKKERKEKKARCSILFEKWVRLDGH